MSEVYKKRTHCAICGNTALHVILDYGQVPLAGYFPSEQEKEKEELFPLNVLFCDKCTLVQTDSIIDADKLFRDYRYMSSIGLQKHFDNVARILVDRFNLQTNSNVVEIGSNDGVLQKPLRDLGLLRVVGFEPARNIAEVARQKGCVTIVDYFNLENAKRYLKENSEDLIVSNNCFAHIDNIKSIVVKFLLKPEGHFVIEVSYLKDLIEKLQYDNIYHEHIYYYSLTALKNLFDQFGMTVVNYDMIPIHSGSIRVTVKNSIESLNPKVKSLLEQEASMGITSLEWFKEFTQRVNVHRKMVKDILIRMKSCGIKVAGYGASGRANMVCNACDLGPDLIQFIVDESPERAGRYIAGKKIPIVLPAELENSEVEIVVVFAWNFYEMIKNKLKGKGLSTVVFFPEYFSEDI
jgi:hypothetical protein